MEEILNTWLLQWFNVSDKDHSLSCTDKIFHGSVKSDRDYYSKAMKEIKITESERCIYVGESIIIRNTDTIFISIKIENL